MTLSTPCSCADVDHPLPSLRTAPDQIDPIGGTARAARYLRHRRWVAHVAASALMGVLAWRAAHVLLVEQCRARVVDRAVGERVNGLVDVGGRTGSVELHITANGGLAVVDSGVPADCEEILSP